MSDRCRSCGAAIIWALTGAGKRIPLDDDPAAEGGRYRLEPDGVAVYVAVPLAGEPLYVSHFATCPDARDWRHRKRAS